MPALLRAGRRLRRRRPRHQGGARRRRVDRQRPEGVDHPRPPRQVGDARRPHRPRGAQAQGHDLLRGRHAGARASRCGRSTRSPARRSSTRCTSPTSASPTRSASSEPGDGWRVVLTTLMNERVAIGGGIPAKGSGFIGEAVKAWKERGHDDPARKDELMALWMRAEVLRLTNIRASQLRVVGNPGPEGSIGKAMSADLNKDITAFTVGLLGAEGMLKPDGYPMERPKHAMSGRTRSRRSSAPAPTRSRAAPRRSPRTSSASACSGCRATSAATRTSPGRRCLAPELDHGHARGLGSGGPSPRRVRRQSPRRWAASLRLAMLRSPRRRPRTRG